MSAVDLNLPDSDSCVTVDDSLYDNSAGNNGSTDDTSVDDGSSGNDTGWLPVPAQLTWHVSGSASTFGQTEVFSTTFTIPSSGGTGSISGSVSATVTVTSSSVSLSGFGTQSGTGYSCVGSGGGSAAILESKTALSASGSISGFATCTFEDGSVETQGVSGSFSASANK